ncbi:hypothetical protein M2322_002109 [Rhodoblastus acidophilus]|uniref:hypothetical protein n=1 Tax=Rhodoblastus acidophilus TaxID=1074 RepID=UPI002225AC45|nr:hypothetical protein [Rhodoblastus acidophilus]MCW2316561.1 hypothetical protein [Rhodoblastus acidophilus]
MIFLLVHLALRATPALAGDFDTKHIFGFTEGTDINAPDEREAEFVTTAHVLKRGGGRYRAVEQQATAEGALTQALGYELTAHGAAVDARGVTGLDSLRRVEFSGLSAEPKFVVLARETAPFGLAFSIEPEWSRIDATSGRRAQGFSAGMRLMADAALGERLYAGANLIYEPEWRREAGAPLAKGALFGATGGLTWRFADRLALGGEVEGYAATESLGLAAPVGTAVYVGPTFFVRLASNLFCAGAWSVQVAGRPAAGRLDDYNGAEFSRHKARLTVSVAF